MIEPSSLTQARTSAIKYLSIREHASLELRHKLARKGFNQTVIDRVLIQLQMDNLLSDERFVESYVHNRMHKGFGPLHIRHELQERGITGELLTHLLAFDDVIWIRYAHSARQKRFGSDLPENQRELSKQVRFLHSRGFTPSQIQATLNTES